jgi:hypothetical protein
VTTILESCKARSIISSSSSSSSISIFFFPQRAWYCTWGFVLLAFYQGNPPWLISPGVRLEINPYFRPESREPAASPAAPSSVVKLRPPTVLCASIDDEARMSSACQALDSKLLVDSCYRPSRDFRLAPPFPLIVRRAGRIYRW